MRYLARFRLLLARRPWVYWLAIGLLLALTWAGVHGAVAAADARRAEWGTTVTVWVAVEAHAGGSPWAVEARDYPAAMVPDNAVIALPEGLAGRVVGVGEIITTADLADAAGPPATWVGLALPAANAPALHTGDPVAVFGNGAPLCDGVAGTVTADGLEVFLPPECAAAAAAHVQAGTVVVGRYR